MNPEKLNRLKADIDRLHAKHTAHPAIILVQPEDSRQVFVLLVGSPSREWICHVMDDVLMRIAGATEESAMVAQFNAAAKTKVIVDKRRLN